ncbi:hypothetical protein BH09VER1_BH09VER1_39180 [soil metagenome]
MSTLNPPQVCKLGCKGLTRLAIAVVSSIFLFASHSAKAASSTWSNGAADNNWQSAGNWNGGTPGTTSGFANTDTANFSTSGSGTINLGGLENIQNINFGIGTGNAGAFTIGTGTDTLNLTSAGAITVGTGVTTTQQLGVAGTTINLSTAGPSSYSFINNGAGQLNVVGNIVGNSTTTATLTVGGSNGGTISGTISQAAGTVALTKIGGGTWTLTSANTYTGATSVSGGGTLDIGGSSSTGSITGSALALGSSVTWSGGKLSYSRTGSNTQAFTSTAINAGASTIENLASSGTITLGALTRASGGAVNFSGPGSITTSTSNVNGILGGYATFGGSTWAVANGAGGAITGLTSFTTSTAGTTAPGTTSNVDFQASNGTAWNTQSVNSLRFNTGTATTLTVGAGQALTVSTGGILVSSTVGNNLSLITGGTLTNGANPIIVQQNNTANGLEIASVVAGSGQDGITKTGAGTLTLSGANTYTGRTYVQGGTLKLGNALAFGDATSTNFAIFSAGTNLDLNGITPTLASGKPFNFLGGGIINSSTTAAAFGNSWTGLGTNVDGFVNTIGGVGDITFSGAISSGRLVKNGNNTMTITGAVSNVGTTLQANSGTSVLNSSSVDGALRGIDVNGNVLSVNTGAVVVMGGNDQIRHGDVNTGIVAVYGGTFDINSKTDIINGLQIGSTDGSTAGNVISTGGAGALTVTGPSTVIGSNKILATNGTASAILAGATTSLTKNTTGTVTLSGANTYGAGTVVSLGTLLANAPVSGTNSSTGLGAVSVTGSATLGGNGQIRPTGANGISVASGGHIAPGSAAIGTLTIDSGGSTATNILSMAAGSDFKFELGTGGTFVAPGTGDLIVIANSAVGDVAFNGNNIDLLGSTSAGVYRLFDGLATAVEASDSWTGLTLGGTSGREIVAGLTVTNLGAGATGVLYLGDGAALGQAGDIYLSVSVPEPSTYAMLLGGLGLAFGAYRARRHQG